MKPFDLYDPKRAHGVKLYVKRVYITDGVEGLIPPFLRFVKGVVDSEDLPLNISREMLQNNPLVAKMGRTITKRILTDLKNMAVDNPGLFKDIWAQFGPVIKEGLYDAHEYRDQLNEVVRFHSTRGEDLVSLQEYIDRMPENQSHIYYISASDIETARKSPQLEGFKAKGVEVLLMADTIDEYWIPMARNFMGKDFKSVTKGAADLSNISPSTDENENLSKDERPDNTAVQPLLEKLRALLGDEVRDVSLSERLTTSAVCLVADESGADMHIERVLKKSQGYEELSKRILEINPKHPVIVRMNEMVAANEDKDLEDAAWLLLDQARIVEGEPLPDPAAFAERMSKMISHGLVKL